MSSHLRYSTSPSAASPIYSREQSTSQPPAKKQKMSLTQTYYLAHNARAKLSREAARADHDLRLLVGHANLLDSLMLDLAEAEREQESWFHHSVKGANKEESKHIQWADSSLPEIDEEDEDSWDGSDVDEEEEISATAVSVPLRMAPSAPTTITTTEIDTESDDDADYEDDEESLALTRTSSRTPPELLHESDSESDDDSMPLSPPTAEIPLDAFSAKQRQVAKNSFYPKSSQQTTIATPATSEEAFYEEGYFLPSRQAVVEAY
ncbi:MAG: hypothetical protein MMC33_000849 [Icmadophila ericetorum]|nr:hypothetical protein [Icmadophila ericetorum]